TWPGAWGRRAAFSSHYSGREYLPSLETIRKQVDGPVGPIMTDISKGGQLIPPTVTDRHAKNDVGGRIDVNKGWTLRIPEPSETRGNFAKLTDNQHTLASMNIASSEGVSH